MCFWYDKVPTLNVYVLPITNSGIENIQIENKDKINILVVHGALNSSKAIDASYNPISEGELKKLGFDYIALGHIHKANYQENTNIVYPGSAISCGFDELGEHGMLDVILEKNKLNIDFIKLDLGGTYTLTIINNQDSDVVLFYQLIDTMAQDSSVSAILKTYAENVCEPADNGHVIWCESNDPKISKFVNYMLNTMNADKNMYGWAYTLTKYGDLYLRLYRESEYEDKKIIFKIRI